MNHFLKIIFVVVNSATWSNKVQWMLLIEKLEDRTQILLFVRHEVYSCSVTCYKLLNNLINY